mgnify:FL=1
MMKLGTVTLNSTTFEHGDKVGTLQIYDKHFNLYQNEDIGLTFYENEVPQHLLTMISEAEYNRVITEIHEYLFKHIGKKVFNVHIITTSKNK